MSMKSLIVFASTVLGANASAVASESVTDPIIEGLLLGEGDAMKITENPEAYMSRVDAYNKIELPHVLQQHK